MLRSNATADGPPKYFQRSSFKVVLAEGAAWSLGSQQTDHLCLLGTFSSESSGCFTRCCQIGQLDAAHLGYNYPNNMRNSNNILEDLHWCNFRENSEDWETVMPPNSMIVVIVMNIKCEMQVWIIDIAITFLDAWFWL